MTQDAAIFPAGLHECSFDEIEKRCVKAFDSSDARAKLFDNLLRFIAVLKGFGLSGQIWLDGSYLTTKIDPSDIDCLIVPTMESLTGPAMQHGASIEALISKGEAKSLFLCDAYLCLASDSNRLAYWRGWFGFNRDGKTAKGIAIITL